MEGGELRFFRTITPKSYIVLFFKKGQVLVLLYFVEGRDFKLLRETTMAQKPT